MASTPLVIVECRYTFVTPTADRFVGCQFVGIEKLAYETGCTTIKTIDVTVTVGTAITSQRHIGIAFVE